MSNKFNTIGIIGRQRKDDISDTLVALKNLLEKHHLSVVVETETAQYLTTSELPTYSRDEIGNYCDLLIVVGGDGSLLNAARAVVDNNTPVLGINRGHLGFLTDINPKELTTKIGEVLSGNYMEEQRFLLNVNVQHKTKIITQDIALNDAVLLPGDTPHLIEFSIFIDEQFVCSHRADGLIIATPTGCTAYALSGGGPILHPHLDALVLVPMFPHTLSARPIVTPANSQITITIAAHTETSPRLSCDGQARVPLPPGSTITITKKKEKLRLIHPASYNYFATLRTKLRWKTKL